MFKLIGYAIQYLPIIITLVKTVEVVAGNVSGAEKKAAVLVLFEKFLRDTLKVEKTDEVLAIAGQLIDLTVSVLNFFGVFGKRTDMQSPEVSEEQATEAVTTALAENPRIKELLETDTFSK